MKIKNHSFTYINSFDGIRGMAALFVLLLHGSYGFFKGGWIGVDLFFVLSGFLITSLLKVEYLNTNTISFNRFYFRRFLRLIPPLIICIIIANLLWTSTKFYQGADQKWANAGALFYFTNLMKGNVSGNLAHLWSLSVEEHFYIFWPLLTLFVIFKMPNRKRIVFLIIFFIVVTISRITYNNFQPISYNVFIIDSNKFTFFKIGGIILGSMLAFINLNRSTLNNVFVSKTKTSIVLITLFLIFTVILFTLNENNVYWRGGGFVLTDLLCLATIVAAIKTPDHFLLSNKLITWVGKRSYGIYVYHYPIFLVTKNYMIAHDVKHFLLLSVARFVLTFVIAELSYKFLEQPILKLKNKLKN